MTAPKSTLPDAATRTTADALQGTLVDLLGLSLLAKQAHWTIVGPRFRSIHLQLDEVVAFARSYSDIVAERSSALGVAPDGRIETVAKTSELPGPANGWTQDNDVVAMIVDALSTVGTRMRERIEATEKPDPVTQDIFLDLTAELEKQRWMFQAENQR